MEPEEVEPAQKRARRENEGGRIPPPPPSTSSKNLSPVEASSATAYTPTVEDMILHQQYGAVPVETEEEQPSTSFAHQPQLPRSVSVGEQGLDNMASSFDETPSSFDEFPSPAVVLEADELTEESKLIYAYNLAINYGLSASALVAVNDLLRLWTGGEHYKNICTSLRSEVEKMAEKYRYRSHYYCRRCDAFLPSRFSVCTTSTCPLQNVQCKRSKEMKRTSVHTVAIRPQLEVVLRGALDDLIAVHRSHHTGEPIPSKSETFHFAAYTADIESRDAFLRGEIHVILTMNLDGVTFKKLSKSEAWPVYLRLEGLSVKKKNALENVIFGGALLTRKAPTEALLSHLLTALQLELRQLEETPLVMNDKTGKSWKCVAKLRHAIMDMAAIRVLYKSPKWGNLYGCHLCRQQDERDGRRVLWHLPLASHHDRRTHENILHDAEAKQYGLAGPTKMMELLTMERCRPDSLHLIDEGLTCDLFKELVCGKGRLKDFRVGKQNMNLLSVAMKEISNYTHSSPAILDLKDLSSCTGSEKRAVLLDHAIVEDVFYAGPPNFWTSAGFESIHKRLQMKVAPNTTNSECFVFERSLLRKDLLWRLRDECLKTGRPEFYSLFKVMHDGNTRRSGIRSELHLGWFMPRYCGLQLKELHDEHRDAVEPYRDHFTLSSHLGRDGSKFYVSRYYWSRPSETEQSCVMIMDADVITFGNEIPFLYEPTTKQCLVFLEEFQAKDPFEGLASSLEECSHLAKGAATDALRGIRRENRFFKEVIIKFSCCVLDSLGLGHDNLRRTVEDLLGNPSMWWIKLGKTDEERETAFNHRKRCRNAWYPELRECIGKALGEVRQWTMVAGNLIPRQKRRRIFGEVGNSSQDSQDGLSEGISIASVEL